MTVKKTPKHPAKKPIKAPEAKASTSFHNCHFEANGPGLEALTAISEIAKALNNNAQALYRLAGFATAPGIVIEAPKEGKKDA